MRKSPRGYAPRVPSNGRKYLSRAEPMAVAVQVGRARRGMRVDVHAVLRDVEVVVVAGRALEPLRPSIPRVGCAKTDLLEEEVGVHRVVDEDARARVAQRGRRDEVGQVVAHTVWACVLVDLGRPRVVLE